MIVLFVIVGEDEAQYIPPPYLSGPDGVPFPLRIVKPSMVFVPMAWTEFDNAAHTSSIQYGYVGHPIPLPPLTFVPGESAVKIRIWMYDYPLIVRAGLYPHFTADSRCASLNNIWLTLPRQSAVVDGSLQVPELLIRLTLSAAERKSVAEGAGGTARPAAPS